MAGSLPRFVVLLAIFIFLLLILFFVRSALDRTVEHRQHAFHFPQLLLKTASFVVVKDSEPPSTLELSIHLVSRSEGDLQESGKLALAALAGTFGTVVADGVDGAKKLRSEPRRGASDRLSEVRVVTLDR